MSAEREHPVATTAQWAAEGVSGKRLRQKVDAGELIVLRRGVYADALAYAEADDAKKHAFYATAAGLLNPGAVVSHQSAAAIHGFDLFQSPGTDVTVTVPPGARTSREPRPGLRVHVADLPEGHVTTAYGVRLTTPARTVVDLARTLSFMTAVVTADSALHTGTVFVHELAAVLGYCRRWPGLSRARRVIEFADLRAESPLESCARVLFAEHGRYQLRRDQYLRETDYRVVHFTHAQLFNETARVIGWHREAFQGASAY